MRKQTAPRTRKYRKASSPQQSGLIAEGTTAQQSAVARCALDNRSHRTTLRISCGARQPNLARRTPGPLLGR